MGINRLAAAAVSIAIIFLSAPSEADEPSSQPLAQTTPAADTGAPQETPPRMAPPASTSLPAGPSIRAPAETPPPPSVTVIDAVEAHGILGRDVRSPANENMGRIVDVIVDRAGKSRAAVIDFGGFLGVGSRKIVVDWSALHFWNVANKDESITLELTRDQVKAAPEYKEDKPIIVLGASGRLAPLRFIP
jgi:hypothetical protein